MVISIFSSKKTTFVCSNFTKERQKYDKLDTIQNN